MKMLRPPVEPWVMRTVSSHGSKPDKVTNEHEDVCTGCQVSGGCDDTDVRCGLVALRQLHSDGRGAKRTVSSKVYRKKLSAFREEHGYVPFPEQLQILARGG